MSITNFNTSYYVISTTTPSAPSISFTPLTTTQEELSSSIAKYQLEAEEYANSLTTQIQLRENSKQFLKKDLFIKTRLAKFKPDDNIYIENIKAEEYYNIASQNESLYPTSESNVTRIQQNLQKLANQLFRYTEAQSQIQPSISAGSNTVSTYKSSTSYTSESTIAIITINSDIRKFYNSSPNKTKTDREFVSYNNQTIEDVYTMKYNATRDKFIVKKSSALLGVVDVDNEGNPSSSSEISNTFVTYSTSDNEDTKVIQSYEQLDEARSTISDSTSTILLCNRSYIANGFNFDPYNPSSITSITIDLNGNQLKFNNNLVGDETNKCIIIKNGATVTIKNGTLIPSEECTKDKWLICNYGNLILDNIKLSLSGLYQPEEGTETQKYIITNYGTLTLQNGTQVIASDISTTTSSISSPMSIETYYGMQPTTTVISTTIDKDCTVIGKLKYWSGNVQNPATWYDYCIVKKHNSATIDNQYIPDGFHWQTIVQQGIETEYKKLVKNSN